MITEIAVVGFLGMLLHMFIKARAIRIKATLSNVKFQFWRYFVDDWLSHLISILAIVLYVYLVRRRVANAPESMHELILAFSATVGYSGADLVARFFSFTNRRINAAIDHKTTIADEATGNTDAPTPATNK